MKKLLLLSALLIFACSSDSEGNPCIYEPTLSTEAVTEITETSATLNGIIAILSENCDVPNNAEQGFVYSTEIQPTLEDIQVNVNGTNISTTLEGLEPNTTYYARSFLTNNLGDFYGNEISFTTLAIDCGLVTDIEGNIYETVVINGQCWTKSNANLITYSDGTIIPQVTDQNQWENLTTGAWCYLVNNISNGGTYGKLYNWYAIMGIHDTDPNTANKEFAPEGWRIPFLDDWADLVSGLGGYDVAGGKLKSTTSLWAPPNTGATNESDFSALPAGTRTTQFWEWGLGTAYWSQTEVNPPLTTNSSDAYWIYLSSGGEGVYLGPGDSFGLTPGYSIRFIKE